MNENSTHKQYLTANSRNEFWELLERYNSGKLRLAHAKGNVCQVRNGDYGTIFTLHNKSYVFKCIGNLSIHPEQEVDFKVFWEKDKDECNDQLFVYKFDKSITMAVNSNTERLSTESICLLGMPGVLPALIMISLLGRSNNDGNGGKEN